MCAASEIIQQHGSGKNVKCFDVFFFSQIHVKTLKQQLGVEREK